MSASAVPSSPHLPTLVSVPAPAPTVPALPSAMKLGLRHSGLRPATARPDEFAGLDRLDRDELDEDYVPPSRRRVA